MHDGFDQTFSTVRVHQVDEAVPATGTTCFRKQSTGVRRLYETTDGFGLRVVLADTTWETGERDISALEAEGPIPVRRLAHGLRLSVLAHSEGRCFVELRQARVKLSTENLWSTVRQASIPDLCEGTGLPVDRTLRSLGAVGADTRAALLDDTSRSRNFLCCEFPESAQHVPVVAYLLTRVLPLKHMVWHDDRDQIPSPWTPPEHARGGGMRRVYTVLLNDAARKTSEGSGAMVYVGETGKPIEERFREHLVGHKPSRVVRQHGIRLMPELYEEMAPVETPDESKAAEADFAEVLRGRGYVVRG